MTDAHRQFFADLYHFYERYEHPPDWSEDESFLGWWSAMWDDAERLAAQYREDPAAYSMIYGVIQGIEDEYKDRMKNTTH